MPRWLVVVAAGAIVVVDQMVKSVSLALPPQGYGGGFFVRSLNRGVAFSLPVPPWLLIVLLAAGMGTVIMLLVREYQKTHPYPVPFFFILGGAVSNIIDRIRVGAVIDYFSVPFVGFSFNLADGLIVAGIMLMLLKSFDKSTQGTLPR